MADFDMVIRGGTVFDGRGGPGREADVALSGGKIAAVGQICGQGAEEIDARGKIVTPGFVDIHTHYDGQATWDERLTPSSWHGVTTALMGNCGVGFAPCRPHDRDRLVRLMEGVEDIPEPVLTAGLPWNWESFDEYLGALESRPHDIDFAAQVPHGALRVYVMGERGANREPATDDDIAQMAAIARDAVKAGALGFSTSRTLNHQTSDGQPTPTLTAAKDELVGIAMGLKEANAGVLQMVSDFLEPAAEFQMIREMMVRSGRPLSFSLAQSDKAPEGWRTLLTAMEGWTKEGLSVRAQVCGRPVGVLLGLELSFNPLSGHPSYELIKGLPFEDRLKIIKTSEFRTKILSEEAVGAHPFLQAVLEHYDRIFVLGDPPDYEPGPEKSLGAMAAARGISPKELAYDIMLERDGRNQLYFPFLNYADHSLEPSLAMMRHENTVLGLGDGGAHVGMICDGSFPTTMLTFWTRDRTRGEKLPIEWVVKAQTKDTAEAVGLFDRGVVAPGYKADLNVIDYDNLTLHAPEVLYDLPQGGRRLIQRTEGYTATIVSGQVIYRNGEPTQALPGRLIRGAQGLH